MRYHKVILVAAVLSILVGVPALWAQTTATLQGRITDPSGGSLPGAQASVTGDQGSRTVYADKAGFFLIPDLAPGNYRLTASLDAFAPEVKEIELHAGQTLTQNVRLAFLPFSDQVVVTAQKRAETLVQIPASITVLAGDTLEQHRVANLQDLAPLVSGLTVTSAEPGTTRVTMRGINTGGVASTVGIYSDDVPFGSSTGLANGGILAGDFDTFDLARVEVLRGPQGSLYGASSVGGVLKYVMNRPTTKGFEARVLGASETTAGGGPGYSLKGLVNVPLGAQFALRASGFKRFDNGFIDSIGNNPVPSATHPTTIIIGGTRVAENINTSDSSGGRVSAVYEPSNKFSLLLTAQLQDIKSGASNVVDTDPITLKPLNSSGVQSSYYKEPLDTKFRISSATASYDLGAVSLASVTSYGTSKQNLHTDFTTPFAALVTSIFGDDAKRPLSSRLPQTTSTDKFTQELRLASAKNKTFEWLMGGYYTDEKSKIFQQIQAVEAGTGAVASGIPDLAVVSLLSTYKEFALFANTTWHITPRFDLSLGGRESSNKQVASQIADGPLVGGHAAFENLKSSEHPFTYSVAPRFELTRNSSIYARVATGFRPGGPNVLPPNVPAGTPLTYKSDSLTSYETGWKASGADGKASVDLSLYYLDWKDIQLFTRVNGFGINGNGGTAVSKGAELTTSIIPAKGLTFSLNGSYTDAYLTKATSAQVGGLSGDPLPYAPKWAMGLRGDYEWTVGSLTPFVGGAVGYTGDRTYNFTTRTTPGGSLRTIGSYTTIDLRAGADIGRWSLELYGRNLTNEQGTTSVAGAGFVPKGGIGLSYIRPRTLGVSVGVRAW